MQGRVAFITGGSSGIGLATAQAFAKAGASVVIAARDIEKGQRAAETLRQFGGEARFVQADMKRAIDIANAVAETVQTFGRLDYAVNNAGTPQGSGRETADFSEADFDETIAINLKGVWLCIKHEIRQMLQQSPAGGSIVNVSSVNGLGGARNGAIYSASKSGVIALTKSAAQEYAPRSIRVNTLAAGVFQTPMLEGVMRKAAGGDEAATAEVAAQIANSVPIKRIGNPQEAAETIVWLCSDAASYVTGHSMIVDGGLTAYAR